MVNLNTKKKKIESKLQKNRFFKNPKNIKLTFGESAIINLKEGRLELIQINSIRRVLKRLLKKTRKRTGCKREKSWYFGRPNFYLQKKSKNSRMGKGKGSLERKVMRLKKNFILFEFFGVSVFKLKWFLNTINKKSGLRFQLFIPQIKQIQNWCKPNTSRYYYSKYLYLNCIYNPHVVF